MEAKPQIQRWLSIESNPEVMNKFLHNCGLPGDKWEVLDVYELNEKVLAALPQPVLSLILLFPLGEKYEEHCSQQENLSGSKQENPNDLYFMKQTIGNACGSVAMIHAVANNLDRIQLKEGSILKKFLEDTSNQTPDRRAAALECNGKMCSAHDQVAKEGQTPAQNFEDKVRYHYVAFVEKGGHLFELDGRKASPINLGPTTREKFLLDAAKECQGYIKRDPKNLNFSVLALAATKN